MSEYGVKVSRIELINGDAQAQHLQLTIQRAYDKVQKKNPLKISSFAVEPNTSIGKNIRTAIQNAYTDEAKRNPIKIKHIQVSLENESRAQVFDELQSEMNKRELTINVKKIDASQAIHGLKDDLSKMLSGLSIGGLKAFLGTDGVDATKVRANNKALNKYQEELDKAFSKIPDDDQFNMADEYRAIGEEIERIRTLEAVAQEDAIKKIEERIRHYKNEIEIKKQSSAQSMQSAQKEAEATQAAAYMAEGLQNRVNQAKQSLDKLDDGDTKSGLLESIEKINQKIAEIPEKTGRARTELEKLLKADISQLEKDIKEAFATPERKQNETEISNIVSEYDKLITKVREKYDDSSLRDDMIEQLRAEQNEVIKLKEVTTDAQNAALSGMREKVAKSREVVQANIDEQKAEANRSKNEVSVLSKAIAFRQRINEWIKNNSRAYAAYRSQVDQIIIALQDEGNLSKDVLDEKLLAFSKIELAAQKAGITGKTLFGQLNEVWGKLTGGAATAFLTSQIQDKMRMALQAVKDVDAAMTELRKVTDLTAQAYDHFVDSASDMSTRVGSTLADTISSTADFARLGYSIRESSMLAEAALTYKNVGDGIDSISTATESLISTIKAFDVAAVDSMSIVDKYNEVGKLCPAA